MNISKHERRVLHVLAHGGSIRFDRAPNGKIRDITCFTRDGLVLADCTLPVFDRLLRRGLIRSQSGQPYQVTRLGLGAAGSPRDTL